MFYWRKELAPHQPAYRGRHTPKRPAQEWTCHSGGLQTLLRKPASSRPSAPPEPAQSDRDLEVHHSRALAFYEAFRHRRHCCQYRAGSPHEDPLPHLGSEKAAFAMCSPALPRRTVSWEWCQHCSNLGPSLASTYCAGWRLRLMVPAEECDLCSCCFAA